MKRDIITAADIKAARRAGLTTLSIAPEAIVTPQAKEDARDWKIQLLRTKHHSPGAAFGSPPPQTQTTFATELGIAQASSPVPTKEKENTIMSSESQSRQMPGNFAASFPFTLPALTHQTTTAAAHTPHAEPKRAEPQREAKSTEPNGIAKKIPSLREAVLQRVYARLTPGTKPSQLLDQLIDKAMQSATASTTSTSFSPAASSNCAGCCHSCMSGAAVPQKQPCTCATAPWQSGRTEAGGVVAVDNRTLPWARFEGATQGMVNIVDVITPKDGSPMGGGYLEWNATSFPWKLAYAEIDVVLEGELHITSNGKTVIGRPGDMLYIPKDTDVIFSSPGYVKFAYATWPADWSNQGGS